MTPDATGRHHLRFSRTFADPAQARTVAQAVAQEENAIDGARAQTRVCHSGATVEVVIEATDARALRAAKLTWLSLVATAERTMAVADGE